MNKHTSKVKSYYRFQSKVYDATRWAFLFQREKAIDALQLTHGDTVIDFGCGTGLNFEHLLDRGAQIRGIDFSKEMLKQAAQNYPDVELIHGDITRRHFATKTDKAVCTYALSLIPDWKRVIRAMSQALKPDGTLVVLDFVPFKGWVEPLNRPLDWWLNGHGVDMHMNLAAELTKHFSEVSVMGPKSGYCQIAVGKESDQLHRKTILGKQLIIPCR